MYLAIRSTVRAAFYMSILACIVLLPHAIAYTLVPTPPCPTEDSTDCVWNADVQGNGEGRSFVDIGGTAYYFQD